MISSKLERHCRLVAGAFADGSVVPLLGAGANLCDRPADACWQEGAGLPSGWELAQLLADRFGYPPDEVIDLPRVSQFVDLTSGSGPLYDRLHRIFAADYGPNSLHRLLASIPARLAGEGGRRQPMLLVTTNYDDALERAFDEAGEPYDVLVYMAVGEHQGRVVHVLESGEHRPIERPNEYGEVDPQRRSVILKLHGAVDREDVQRDSYVITEDDYIEYLTRASLNMLVPAPVLARLKRSHFLFLGYGLRDWNLRVILHRIWKERIHGYRSWAVQLGTSEVDEEFWERRDVDLHAVPLAEYAEALSAALPPPAARLAVA